MLKIVVFDSGYGGELFADKLEDELVIAKIIRVIDWRRSEEILKDSKSARQAALESLRPYIGRVDLIVFANHLLTATSLKFFQRKFKNQMFLGFHLPEVATFIGRPTMALTTKALARTAKYRYYLLKLNRKVDTFCVDDWPALIDDGELNNDHIYQKIEEFRRKNHYLPAEIILACGQLNDIIPNLREILGVNIKIHDSFNDTFTAICKSLKLRGSTGKKK